MAKDILDVLNEEGALTPEEYTTAKTGTDFVDADGNAGYWKDGDTLEVNGVDVRLTGIDTLEVDKYRIKSEGIEASAGEVGGAEQAAFVKRLADQGGYNRLVPDVDPVTGKDTDQFGRKLMKLVNNAGSSIADDLQAEGVVATSKWTTNDALEDRAFSQIFRAANEAAGVEGDEWQQAATFMDQFMAEEGAPVGLKQLAMDEIGLKQLQGAGGGQYFYDDQVQIRHGDRNIDNTAKNPMSVSFDKGLKGVVEGATGLLNLVGHETGWKGLEDWAEGAGEGIRQDLAAMPETIVDYRDVDNTGDFIEYVGNLAAMSLPYMALSIGSVPFGAVGVAAPASVYAGQVWNEMEGEKNAAAAIAGGVSMAVLDRLGIKGIANSSVLSGKGRQQIMTELMSRGMTRAEANAAIVGNTRHVVAQFSGDAAKFAKQQLNEREVLRQTIRGLAAGTTSEGLTEVSQEIAGYLAAVGGSDKTFDAADLNNRIVQAAVGGGVLGGALSIPGTAYNTGAWADVAYRLEPADQARRTQEAKWAEEERKRNNGQLPDHKEILDNAEKSANRKVARKSINARADVAKADKAGRSITEVGGDLVKNIPGLWRGATRFIFNEDLQSRSVTARRMASLFSGQLQPIYGGATFENAKHLRLAEYKNIMDMPHTTIQEMGFKTPIEASDVIYKAYNLVGTDWDRLVGTDMEQHIPAIKKFAKAAQDMTDKVHKDQKKYNPQLNYIKDYAFKARSLDKVAIEKDKHGFQNDLIKQFGLDQRTAEQLTNAILDIDSASDIDQAFSLVEKGGFQPTSHRERTLGLSENREFASKWMSNDIFLNLSNVAKSGARYSTYQEYLGDNNKKIEAMIDDMEAELIENGMTPAEAEKEANRVALGMKNYLDAESGNYNRPNTKFGQTMRDIQRNAMFYTTIAALPLATLSSMVELALTTKALDQAQIKQVSDYALKNAKGMFNIVKTDEQVEEKGIGHQRLKDLGYFEWDVGAATVTGATEGISGWRQDAIDTFFKAIGLKQWTDYTRAIRASIAGDYIMNKAEVLQQMDPDNPTNEDVEAQDALSAIGIDWRRLLEADPKSQEMADMLNNGTFNFINDAVVLPQAALRPLFYQDPRFALFTQFHGFISTFQANHLPKLYRQAFKGQTPSMKYNAFAVMASMIALGFLSQYLKDLLKYGGEPPEWLTDDIIVRRAINSSGLLGSAERILGIVNPMYESRYDNTFDWAFDTLVGESAAASFANRGAEAAAAALEGEGERAFNKSWKFIPIFGPLTGVRDKAADWAFDE